MQLIPINEMTVMADAIAKSGLFGLKTTEQALALGLLCQAEGRHPAEAARDYHIIGGRPSLKADAMLARFQAAGGRVEWSKVTDAEVVGTFSHPQGGSVTIDWTIERAKQAGLLKNETWSKYPRQMLKSRCISEAIRMVLPGVLSGLYTPEETESFTEPIVRIEKPLQLEDPLAIARRAFENSQTLDELKAKWTAFCATATKEEISQLEAVKNQRKGELE